MRSLLIFSKGPLRNKSWNLIGYHITDAWTLVATATALVSCIYIGFCASAITLLMTVASGAKFESAINPK